jgi:small subunit ribosomal protein S1
MPGSQVDVKRVPDLETLIGHEIEAYVIDFNEQQGRAVLSRRKLLAERQDSERQQFLQSISAGSSVTGRVREILDFGAFIEVGPVQGLLPRTEISYDRSVKPDEYLKVGQEIPLKVLDVAADTGRLTLSRKRVGEDPWTSVQNSYPMASTVTGKVVAIQSFGAFVQLEEGVTGLIHSRDISWESDRKSPEDIFKVGDQVTCQVIEIDSEHRRLGLSLRHLARDPWLDVADKYPVGSRHNGKITRLKDYGAFVRLDENVEGLLHIGDITWEKRLKHPNEMLTEDQDLEVTVLSHDPARRRISLGHKQLTGSPFDEFIAAHPVGSVTQGTVSRIVPFGVFLTLAPGLEGLIHISELDENRVESPERVVRQNEPITVKILAADPAKQKISLSRKEAIRDQEQENITQYTSSESSKKVGLSFGDALKAAMDKKK